VELIAKEFYATRRLAPKFATEPLSIGSSIATQLGQEKYNSEGEN
jgi:hypothetical protein